MIVCAYTSFSSTKPLHSSIIVMHENQDGGYLELRYVRINQSREGLLRPTTPIFEGITPSGLVRRLMNHTRILIT